MPMLDTYLKSIILGHAELAADQGAQQLRGRICAGACRAYEQEPRSDFPGALGANRIRSRLVCGV
ncbi:hypothetical protein [Micromonospora sp. NPDC006431]|uniref:hypothetical protein n=1 Tax=Micromonospora sp. NPDC006431 TaxID=3364235 RepID=UPI0036C7837B